MAVKINELRQRAIEARRAASEARAEHKALLDKNLAAATARKGGFTDDERAANTAAAEKVAAAERALTDAEEILAAEEQRLELERASGPTKAAATVSAPNFEKDPRKGFGSHRDFLLAAMANGGLRDRSQISDDRLKPLAVADKDDKSSAGELAYMLPHAFTPRSIRAAAGSDEQGEYDVRYGGYAVTTVRLPGILEVGFEGDPTAGRTRNIPMRAPTVEIPARTDKDHTSSVSGGFTVARKAETVAATASRMTLEMVTLKASSLFGLAYATEELLADSAESFAAIIDAGFRSQFGAHMLNEKLRGKGGDQYLGVLTALAASSLGPTVSIAKEAGQLADTIVSSNVIKMRARAWGYQSAIWIANPDCFPQLATMSIGVGAAGVLVYQQSLTEDRPDMLLGRPIFYSEYAATVGDQGDIILGSWGEFLEGIYQPLQGAESVHVRFVNHERTFKFWLRNAGAPWWRSALTPNKGSNTLSPFVVLDARA